MSALDVWAFRWSKGRIGGRSLWPKLVAMYHDFDDYQARSDSEIPVVILSAA